MKNLVNKFFAQKIRNTLIAAIALIAADTTTLAVAFAYYESYGLVALFTAVALAATAAVVLLKERDPWGELPEEDED